MEHKLNAAIASLKRNQRVWIIVGVAVVLISGLIATFVTAESVASSAAKSSIDETKAYLDRVVEASQSSQAPQDIKTAVNAIKRPIFPEIALGSISESYRLARTFHGEVSEKVDTFKRQLDAYVQLQTFDKKYQQLTTQLNQLELSDTEQRYTSLQDVNKLIGQTKAPTDFTDKFTEVGRVYTSMEHNWEGMLTAQKMGNEQAYEMLTQQYNQAAAQVPRVQADIRGYVDTITEKVKSIVNDLKKYREDL